MKKKLSVLLLLLVTITMSAQTNTSGVAIKKNEGTQKFKDYRDGYVIQKNGETLFGKIAYKKDYKMNRSCIFLKGEDIMTFNPNQIQGYRFTNGRFFVSKMVNRKRVFLEFLVKGKMNLYYFMNDVNKQIYFVENQEGILRELPYEEKNVYIEKDDASYFQRSKKHQGVLSLYTADAPKLKNEILRLKKPTHKGLIKLAKRYHEAVCDTACIEYKTKSGKLKYFLEVSGGVASFKYEEEINVFRNELVKNNGYKAGAIIHIAFPELGGKWYLRSGLELFSFQEKTDITETFKVPVHLEYIHYSGKIRPRISIGVNFGEYLTTSTTLGFNIRLTDSKFISVVGDFVLSSLGGKETPSINSVNLGYFFKL